MTWDSSALPTMAPSLEPQTIVTPQAQILQYLEDPDFHVHLEGGQVWASHPEMGDARKSVAMVAHIDKYYKILCSVQRTRERNFAPVNLIPEREALGILQEMAKDKHQMRLEQAKGKDELFDSEREFIEFEAKKLGFSELPNGTCVKVEDGFTHDFNRDHFKSYLIERMTQYNRTIPKVDGKPVRTTLQKDNIQAVLDNLSNEQGTARKQRWMQEHVFQGHGDIDEVVTDILSIYYIKTTPENIAAFKHMLWSIKRKAYRKDIPFPLFFTFQSNQGGMGKTWLVRLMAPEPWMFRSGASLNDVGKPKEFKSTIRGAHLIDFEELAMDDTDMHHGTLNPGKLASLKALCTADTVSSRGMYTSANVVEWQSAVLAASAQIHIYDLVQEPAAMRRFWEFKLEPPKDFDRMGKDASFWITANKYWDNIGEIYKMIDENDDKGFYHPGLPEYKNMGIIQDGYSKADAITLFLESKRWVLAEASDRYPDPNNYRIINEEVKEITLEKLASLFKTWKESMSDKGWTGQFLSSQINSIHHIAICRDIPGKSGLYFYRELPKDNSQPPKKGLYIQPTRS